MKTLSFKVNGSEIYLIPEIKDIKKCGNSSHIYLPKKYAKKEAIVGIFKEKREFKRRNSYKVDFALNGLKIVPAHDNAHILLSKKYFGYYALVGVQN